MSTRYNERFIDLMEKLNEIMLREGEQFRARAYSKAKETIMSISEDIIHPSQLKGKPGIGDTIFSKLSEFFERGTLDILEREKNNPINLFANIYGIGPKKANELVSLGITNIQQLRERQNECLNDTQKIGLYYYEQIQQRIPRSEIQEFEKVFKTMIPTLEIVGSYRRGALDSGDIDVIIKGDSRKYEQLVDVLVQKGIILEILSRGPSKTLVIARLFSVARRIDFLYTSENEFPFAILYFTGSKWFNTAMRQFALDKGYTFNEHGMYHIVDKKKGNKVNNIFRTEQDIFDFLGLTFKVPHERKDGRDVLTTPIGLINEFKTNGINVLEQYDENTLNTIIEFANNHYYNTTPIMTDNQYDIIKGYIARKYPKATILSKVGAKVSIKETKLPYPMPSLDKIKPDTDSLDIWIRKFPGNYTVTAKLDGVSGLYTTEHNTPQLFTRGDGEYGSDISHLIPYLRLPNVKNISIRGEFIISQQVFNDKYKHIYSNTRNMCSGVLLSKQINVDLLQDINFIPYEVLHPPMKPSDQLTYLQSIGPCVHFVIPRVITNNFLSTLLVELRQTHTYGIDGLVVKHDDIYPKSLTLPTHAFAFKMVLADQIAESIVVDVLWSPSKDGYLKPRVQIEPVKLCGVTIEFATGFNAAFIKNNNIGIGATIQIIRSGDVIPHIREVVTPAESPKMPNMQYTWNDTNVDIILVNANEDPIVKEKNITGFFKGIGVEGLGAGNVTRLISAGFDSIPQILRMNVNDFLTVEGFKEKMANKLFIGIQEKIKESTIIQLMASTNIFGRGFSEKKMETIIQELPNILNSNESNDIKIIKISSLKGFSSKSAETFVDKINEFVIFLKECNLEYKLTNIHTSFDNSLSDHPLTGKNIVLTGTRDKDIIDLLKHVRCTIASSVSQNTYLLVAKNKNDDTGKASEARKLNIPILSVEEFIQTYMSKN
jgi:DNA ligase (NAD+)